MNYLNDFTEILIYPNTKWKEYGNNKDMRSACFKKVDEDLKKCFEDAAYMFNETVLRTNDKNSTRKTHFAAAFYNIIQPSGDPFTSSFFIMYLRKAKKFKMITRKMN